MRTIAFTLVLLMLLASPGAAQNRSVANPRVDDASNQRASLGDARVLDQTYTTWFDRRLAVVEADLATQKSSGDMLSLELAIIGVGFGALITLVVVFFALRTERTAASAAAQAADEAIAASKEGIERLVREAQLIKVEADQVLLSIKQGQGEVELHVGKIKAAAALAEKYTNTAEGKDHISEQEGNVISAGADALKKRSAKTWSYDDFTILIIDAFEKGEFNQVEDLCRMMKLLVSDERTDVYTDNMLGNVRLKQRKYPEAAEIFKRIVDNNLDACKKGSYEIVLGAARNLALAYLRQKEFTSVVDWTNRILSKLKYEELPKIKSIVANFYYNRAEANFKLGELDLAVSDIDLMFGMWDSNDKNLTDRIASNVINLAAIIRDANPQKSFSLLKELAPKLAEDQDLTQKYMSKALSYLRQSEGVLEKVGK